VVGGTARPGCCRELPPAGGSRFLPTREQTKQHHKPASHHECKNTPTSLSSVRGTARHRPPAGGPTPHTAET